MSLTQDAVQGSATVKSEDIPVSDANALSDMPAEVPQVARLSVQGHHRTSSTSSAGSIEDLNTRKRKVSNTQLLEPQWHANKVQREPSPAGSSTSNSSSTTRPATFLHTLCAFLDANPANPYMRWAHDGSYFVVLNKEMMMQTIIAKMFNQKSYASLARQLNIYGFRRLQVSPCGTITAAEHNVTMWQHPDSEEDLKNVKRNATDKVKRDARNSPEADQQMLSRPRPVVSTQAYAQASALTTRIVPTSQSDFREPQQRIGKITLTNYKAQPTFHTIPATAVEPDLPLPPKAEGERHVRPLPLRMGSQTRRTYGDTSLPSPAESISSRLTRSDSSYSLRNVAQKLSVPETQAQVASSAPVKMMPANMRYREHARTLSNASSSSEHPASTFGHRKNNSRGTGFKLLPGLLSVRRTNLPTNSVDVYVACNKEDSSTTPTVIARDRLDIPIWVDDLAQSRFVLAGDIMRSWVIWDIFNTETLVYVACSDASRPPRPIGVPAYLRDCSTNDHPSKAYSRERVYLESSAEPGSVGQCCLVFHSPQIAAMEASESSTAAQDLANQPMHNESGNSNMLQGFANGVEMVRTVSQGFLGSLSGQKKEEDSIAPSALLLNQPGTPQGTFRQPLSQERGTALQEDAEMLSAAPLATPSTANAISSLAYMQILAHAQVQAAPSTPRSARIPATPLDATLGQDQQQEALDLLMNVQQEGSDGISFMNDLPSSAARQNFDMQAIEAC